MITEAPPAAPPRRIAYVPALDGMRGISLPGTIYTHFGLFLGGLPTAPLWLKSDWAPFTLNIEMFFVLSGALITSLLVAEHQRDGTIALGNFYLRRSRRLAPALLAVVPVLLVVQFLLPSHGSTFATLISPLGASAWITAIYLLLFVGNWRLASGGNLGWLGPAWTLGIEEQFYLTWPTLLRVALRRNWSRRQIIAGFWAVIALSVVVSDRLFPHYGPGRVMYLTPSQLPPILIGCALGFALTTHADGWFVRALRSRLVALVGLGGMVAVSITLDGHPHRLILGGYIVYAGFACLLIGHCFISANRPSLISRFFGWKPFVIIGQVSYEAYLVHCVVILAVLRIAPQMPVTHMIALDVVLISGISGAFYYLIEQPIRRRGWSVVLTGLRVGGSASRRRIRTSAVLRRRGLLAGFAAGIAVVTAISIVVTGGALSGGSHGAATVGAVGTNAAGGQSASVQRDSSQHGQRPATSTRPVAKTSAGRTGSAPSTAPVLDAGSPQLISVRPAAGPLRGGTTVMITGRQLDRVATVEFGDAPAQRFTVLSATRIRAVTPARLVAASVPIAVRARDEPSASARCGAQCMVAFAYLPVPAITKLMPALGSIVGGARITITGSGFSPDSTVRFGKDRLTEVERISSSTLIVTSPAAQLASVAQVSPVQQLHGLAVNVVITTPGGSSASSPLSTFTYV